MDDLLDNFANMDSPNVESTIGEGYIYHFVDESPAPLEHNRPVHPTMTAQPNNYTSFVNIESPPPYQSTGGENEDEGNYNADIDDDDDDDDVFGSGLGRKEPGYFKPASALRDDGQDLGGFEQHLRRFHRQDLERDDLLTVRPLSPPLDSEAC